MKLLAVETATEACSVALLIDGQVRERYRVAPRQHTELVLEMADELLHEAAVALPQLDAIAFGRGPGAFTGVRIAVSVTQGLAFGADLPVVPVSTLQALACGAAERHGAARVAAAIDARMGEVYWGLFEQLPGGTVVARSRESVCAPGDVEPGEDGGWYGAGSGWESYGSELRTVLGDGLVGVDGDLLPRAFHVARLAAPELAAGRGLPAEQALPVYLRDRVVQRPAR